MSESSNLLPLIQQLENIKTQEQALKKERARLEAELAKAFVAPLGGSKTYPYHGYKVTTKAPVNYKLDAEAWAGIEEKIPPALRPIKNKPEPDPTGCKWLANNEPDLWAICAQAITATPGKPAVTVQPNPTE